MSTFYIFVKVNPFHNSNNLVEPLKNKIKTKFLKTKKKIKKYDTDGATNDRLGTVVAC